MAQDHHIRILQDKNVAKNRPLTLAAEKCAVNEAAAHKEKTVYDTFTRFVGRMV